MTKWVYSLSKISLESTRLKMHSAPVSLGFLDGVLVTWLADQRQGQGSIPPPIGDLNTGRRSDSAWSCYSPQWKPNLNSNKTFQPFSKTFLVGIKETSDNIEVLTGRKMSGREKESDHKWGSPPECSARAGGGRTKRPETSLHQSQVTLWPNFDPFASLKTSENL